jgi:hypothetical protein
VNYRRCHALGGFGHFGVVIGYVPSSWLLVDHHNPHPTANVDPSSTSSLSSSSSSSDGASTTAAEAGLTCPKSEVASPASPALIEPRTRPPVQNKVGHAIAADRDECKQGAGSICAQCKKGDFEDGLVVLLDPVCSYVNCLCHGRIANLQMLNTSSVASNGRCR